MPASDHAAAAHASAADVISWVTSAGWETMATWLEGTSTVRSTGTGGGDVVAVGLQALDDAAPARAVGPCAVDEDALTGCSCIPV